MHQWALPGRSSTTASRFACTHASSVLSATFPGILSRSQSSGSEVSPWIWPLSSGFGVRLPVGHCPPGIRSVVSESRVFRGIQRRVHAVQFGIDPALPFLPCLNRFFASFIISFRFWSIWPNQRTSGPPAEASASRSADQPHASEWLLPWNHQGPPLPGQLRPPCLIHPQFTLHVCAASCGHIALFYDERCTSQCRFFVSAHFPHDLHRLLQIPFGIDLRDVGRSVPQNDLGSFQPVPFPNLCSGGVA